MNSNKRYITKEQAEKIKSLCRSDCSIPLIGELTKEQKEIILHLLEIVSVVPYEYDKTFGDYRLCTCGHVYYRHFDTYDYMYPVGCKYCRECEGFEDSGNIEVWNGNEMHVETFNKDKNYDK